MLSALSTILLKQMWSACCPLEGTVAGRKNDLFSTRFPPLLSVNRYLIELAQALHARVAGAHRSHTAPYEKIITSAALKQVLNIWSRKWQLTFNLNDNSWKRLFFSTGLHAEWPNVVFISRKHQMVSVYVFAPPFSCSETFFPRTLA